jgi:UDP-N-acetylmuramoyl-tripeptide--D-alanyl-D-alanine ligase
MTLTAADIVEAVGGRLLSGAPHAVIPGFSIDSRTTGAGDLFVAIRGERFDGHAFVDAALARGASGALVSEPGAGVTHDLVSDRVLIAVADTTLALQRLAWWVRRRAGARVVAITGSAGKTTTKEMAAAFLGLRYRVMRSSGNLNNHIGLPLSLLELRHDPEVAVVELGMNHAGEISRLVAIAEPDVRVWTNVAEVHIEFFGSVAAIADAKAEVLEGATADTLLVANADDSLVMDRARRFAGRTVTFSTTGEATVSAANIEDAGLAGIRALVRTPVGARRLELPLAGRANLENALAAIAVALEFGVPIDEVAERARTLRPAAHRGDVLRLARGITVVDDAYNANPRAVRGALAILAGETGFARRVAVLGEMLELGSRSQALHEAVGGVAAGSGLSWLLTVGGEPARALGRAAVAAGMSPAAVWHADTSAEAAAVAVAAVRPGDLVLVKGSRGIGTERVVERLAAEFG